MHSSNLLSEVDHIRIITEVQKGLDQGYHQNIDFLNRYNSLQTVIREYLLTVNVAQRVQELLRSQGKYAVDVNLEYSAQRFKSQAFPSLRIDVDQDIPFKLDFVYAKPKSINRKGFLDLAIMQDGPNGLNNGPRSYMGIELKAFCPKNSLIIKDIERLADIMLEEDEIAPNSVSVCLLAFLQRLDNPKKPFHANEIEPARQKFIARLKTILSGYNYPNINFNVYTDLITKSTAEEYLSKVNPDEGDSEDYHEAADESGCVISVIVEIYRSTTGISAISERTDTLNVKSPE